MNRIEPMTTPEPDKLSNLLRQWPGIEPRPAFEQDVLRRLRLEATRPAAAGLWSWLPAWLGSPTRLAWGAVLPLILALLVGIVSNHVLPAADTHAPTPYGGLSVLDSDTVTGGYIAMLEAR